MSLLRQETSPFISLFLSVPAHGRVFCSSSSYHVCVLSKCGKIMMLASLLYMKHRRYLAVFPPPPPPNSLSVHKHNYWVEVEGWSIQSCV